MSKLHPELIAKLINPGNAVILPGLERIKIALEILKNPQYQYKVIHIAGTNGKGSTAAFIETGLIHAGFRVGKFSSPYIYIINESIRLNGLDISNQDLENQFFIIKKILNKNYIKLSPFEYLTVIMFQYFANQNIDYLVLEAGMGGTDDATNVVSPLISIITNISLEHTAILGNSLDKIAYAKSGIVKDNFTIIADNTPELIDAVKKRTDKYVNVLNKYNLIATYVNKTTFTTQVTFNNSNDSKKQILNFSLSLFGKFQAYNFLCAYEVFKQLNVSNQSIEYAAANTKLTGRLQVLSQKPLIIIDATHNESGARQLYYTLNGLYDRSQIIIITAILGDKNIDAMLKYFNKITDTIIFTTIPDNPRAISANELTSKLSAKIFIHRYTINDPKQALSFAKKLINNPVILVTGSLYLLSHLGI